MPRELGLDNVRASLRGEPAAVPQPVDVDAVAGPLAPGHGLDFRKATGEAGQALADVEVAAGVSMPGRPMPTGERQIRRPSGYSVANDLGDVEHPV